MTPALIEQLQLLVLGLCLLLMCGVNIFALLKLMPLIDSEDKGIHDVKGLNEQILRQLTQLAARPSAAQGTPDDDAQWLDQFESPFNAISMDSIHGLDATLDSSESLLTGLAAVGSGAEWNAWNDANRERLHSLQNAYQRQRGALFNLQSELEQARQMIHGMRANSSRSGLASMQLATLKARNDAHETELLTLRAERSSGLRELQLAHMETERLREQVLLEQGKLATANVQIEHTREQLEGRLKLMEEGISSLQATHDRTIMEKKFIEEAFVRLDQHFSSGVGQENPGTA